MSSTADERTRARLRQDKVNVSSGQRGDRVELGVVQPHELAADEHGQPHLHSRACYGLDGRAAGRTADGGRHVVHTAPKFEKREVPQLTQPTHLSTPRLAPRTYGSYSTI